MGSMYYDRQGREIDADKWSELFRYKEYKRVANTELKGVQVSTIWLGLNHQWDGGKPLVFETMVFGGKHDKCMERYTTESEARIGHARMVSKVKPWWKRWAITFAPKGEE